MDLSIVTITWRSKEDILRFITSIKRHLTNLKYEIIIIDNSPDLETFDFVKQNYPELLIVHNDDNPGYARGMNQGFSLSRGKYVAYMNPDMEVLSDCFTPLITQLDSNPRIGLIAPQLQYGDRTVQPTAKNDPTLASQLPIIFKVHHHLKTKALKKYLAKDFDYNREQPVEQLMGAFLMGKRETIEVIGGWDKDYPLWWEDLQFCTDTRRAGFLVYYYPLVKVIHYEGRSFAQVMSLSKQKRFSYGLCLYFKKNKPYWQYLVVKTLVPISLILAWIVQLLKIKPRTESRV